MQDRRKQFERLTGRVQLLKLDANWWLDCIFDQDVSTVAKSA